MDNLTHDIMESKMAKGAQLQHVWDDDEEPVSVTKKLCFNLVLKRSSPALPYVFRSLVRTIDM